MHNGQSEEGNLQKQEKTEEVQEHPRGHGRKHIKYPTTDEQNVKGENTVSKVAKL